MRKAHLIKILIRSCSVLSLTNEVSPCLCRDCPKESVEADLQALTQDRDYWMQVQR